MSDHLALTSPPYKLNVKKPSLLLLILLVSFGSMNAVLFTPAFPKMESFFHISAVQTQFLITIFLIGYALSQLIYGPIANRFGRKTAVLFLTYVTIFANLLGLYALQIKSYDMLLTARLINSLGSCGGFTMGLTIINDFYYHRESRKVTALASLAFAVIPFLATFIGGILVRFLSWKLCFHFLLIYSLLLLLGFQFLPETLKKEDRKPIHVFKILKDYLHVIKEKNLLRYAMVSGLATSLIYIYVSTAPQIAINILGLTPFHFSLMNLFIAIGYFLGNVISALLSKKFSATTVIGYGIIISFVGALLIFTTMKFNLLLPAAYFTCVALMYLGIPKINSNALVLGISSSTSTANASSVVTFISMALSVLSQYIMTFFTASFKTAVPWSFLILLVAVFFFAYFPFSLRFGRVK